MVWRNMRNFFYAQSPAEDDPVRMVDVWVESLDLEGFRKLYKECGCSPYHFRMMHKTRNRNRKNIPAIKLKKGRIEGYSSFLPFSDYRTF